MQMIIKFEQFVETLIDHMRSKTMFLYYDLYFNDSSLHECNNLFSEIDQCSPKPIPLNLEISRVFHGKLFIYIVSEI